jgi:hypothetical protein
MQMTPDHLTKAFALAKERGLLPTTMGSAEIRAMGRSIIETSVVSARVTSAVFLSEVKALVEGRIAGVKDSDMGAMILHLQRVLQRLGYDPLKGFPGDDKLGIPPAEPGSLQDLSSWARLLLIIDTQSGVLRGKAEQLQGFDPISLALAPAWEFMRIESRNKWRGAPGSSTDSWYSRWVKLGGPAPIEEHGVIRLIALKTDPIWYRLGCDPMFKDILNTDYPPFAFKSGWGWIPVPRPECIRLGIDLSAQREVKIVPSTPSGLINWPRQKKGGLIYVPAALPPPVINLDSVDPVIAKSAKSNMSAKALLDDFDANFLKEVGLAA